MLISHLLLHGPISAFVLEWQRHELHHLFAVSGFGSRCRFVDWPHPIKPGPIGHHFPVGKWVCHLWGTYGRMQPQ